MPHASHADPTANAAIGNVTREARRRAECLERINALPADLVPKALDHLRRQEAGERAVRFLEGHRTTLPADRMSKRTRIPAPEPPESARLDAKGRARWRAEARERALRDL